MSEPIQLVEVGARDGLQNEQQIVEVATRVELIQRLRAAGLTTIEAGAFVSPKWVPQMADTDAVLAALKRTDGAPVVDERPDDFFGDEEGSGRDRLVSYPVLVPNLQGYRAAAEADADTVAIFAAASEAFSHKNINVGIAESLERFRPVAQAALGDGRRVRGYVSCVLGCPYQGSVEANDVLEVCLELLAMGCYEISLGDTIGVGTAGQVRSLIRSLSSQVPVSMLAGHFHDTYGQALANVFAALEEGVRTFDSSVSGLGGCPYARGATGNVATEDLVYLLEGSGYDTGVDLDALVETSRWISDRLDRAPASRVTTARS